MKPSRLLELAGIQLSSPIVLEAKEAVASVASAREAMIDRIEGYFGALESVPYHKIDTVDLATIYQTLLDHKQIPKVKG